MIWEKSLSYDDFRDVSSQIQRFPMKNGCVFTMLTFLCLMFMSIFTFLCLKNQGGKKIRNRMGNNGMR